MKYENIKVGDVFTYNIDEETVIYKNDKCRIIVTIDCCGGPTPWHEKDLHFLKPIKEQLPEEGLLVSEGGSLVYKLSDGSGYGFVYGNQSDYYFNKLWKFSRADHWQPATPEQEIKFVEMLKKECEKRGLFEDTKIEDVCDPNFMGVTPRFSLTHGYNKNGQISYKGNFATPRKEDLLDKLTEVANEFGNHIIEKTESGIIILTPNKK